MARAVDDKFTRNGDPEGQDPLPGSYILPKKVKFGFHPVTGRNIVLSEDRRKASRLRPRQGLGGCIVYGEKPLKGTCEMEVKITNYDNAEPKTSIRIGVMKMKLTSRLTQESLPRYSEDGDDYCVLLGQDVFNNFSTEGIEQEELDRNKKHEWISRTNADHLQESNIDYSYSPVSLNELTVGDRVGMHLTKDGDLLFLINDQSLGVAATNIYWEGFKVYPVVDIIGKCCSVKITRAG